MTKQSIHSHSREHPQFCNLLFVVCLCFSTIQSVFGTINIESIEFGLGDHYKRDRWIPLHILTVSENEPEEFLGEIIVEVNNAFSGENIQVYSVPLSLMRTDRRRHVLYVFQPGTSTKLTLTLLHTDGRVYANRVIVPSLPKEPRDLLILELTSPGKHVLNQWNGRKIDSETKDRVFVSHARSHKSMPSQWKGYDSIDLLAIRDVSLTWKHFAKRQQVALLDWVQSGGTLLISGGSNIQYLRNSFLEPLLPVHLGRLKTALDVPALFESFGLKSASPIDLIEFESANSGETLFNNEERILVSRRFFGSGQIVCLAFDYNTPLFSQLPESNQFWMWLFKSVGKSPRRFADRYEAYRRDGEKMYKLLSTLSSVRVPLIRMLSLFLLTYLVCMAGFLWWVGRPGQQPRTYWIGSSLITIVFSCAVLLSRHFLPVSMSVNRFSILSTHTASPRAELQTYFGITALAESKSSIQFKEGTFIKPLTPQSTDPIHLVEAKNSQLRQMALSGWKARGYFVESFLNLPQRKGEPELCIMATRHGTLESVKHYLPGVLENSGVIHQKQYTYLGTVPPNTFAKIGRLTTTVAGLPSLEELSPTRERFSRILSNEGVLQYLTQETTPKLVGWMRKPFLPMNLNHPAKIIDETFVIVYLNGDRNLGNPVQE